MLPSLLWAFLATTFATTVLGADVACVLNGETVDIVDYDTGVCTFTIPDEYPAYVNFYSDEEFDAYYYYIEVGENQNTTDIYENGRAIAIDARVLNGESAQIVQVYVNHLQNETDSSEPLRTGSELTDEDKQIFENRDVADDDTDTPLDLIVSIQEIAESSTEEATEEPTETSTDEPAESSTEEATESDELSGLPTEEPTEESSATPSGESTEPSEESTIAPTESDEESTEEPTEEPSGEPTETSAIPTASDEESTEEISNAPTASDEESTEEISSVPTASNEETSGEPTVSDEESSSEPTEEPTESDEHSTAETSESDEQSTAEPSESDEQSTSEPTASDNESTEGPSETSTPSETPSLVACLMNDETVSVVSYATGVCTFTIPDEYEIFFNYISNNEFDIQYYYARVSGNQYTNNIRNAGRTLSIPARILFNLVLQVHQVHLQEPASSSSSGFEKRDEIDDFLDSVLDTDGTPVDINLSAVAADDESSVSESGTESVTDVESESVSETIQPSESVSETEDQTSEETSSESSEPFESESETASASETESASVFETESATESDDEVTTIRSTSIITESVCSDEHVSSTIEDNAAEVTGTDDANTEATGTDDANTEATATDDNNNEATGADDANTEATGADDNNTEATGADDETTNKGTVAGTTHKDTSTVTGTEIVTVTSCKNDACHVTTVPGTETTVTTTVNGVETIYTTYCPVSSIETVQESKTITVIACKEDKCHETTAVAVPSTVQEVVEQTTTVYITYKPVSTPADETIATNVVTSGSGIYVPVPTAITSGETVVESTVYVTVTKISDTHPSTIGAPLPPATIAENPEPVTLISEGTTIHTTAVGEGISPGSTVYTILTGETSVSQQVPSETIASISTFTGGAASRSVSSLLGMLLIPILYLI